MCWAPGGRSQTRSGCGLGSSSARRRVSSGSGCRGGEQLGGEGAGDATLARAARALEEVGVGGVARQRRAGGEGGAGLMLGGCGEGRGQGCALGLRRASRPDLFDGGHHAGVHLLDLA